MTARGIFVAAAVCVCVSLCSGTGVLWTEATEGSPGQQVVVIVKATTDSPVIDLEVAMGYDTTALTLLSADFSHSPIIAQAAHYGLIPYAPEGVLRARITLYIGGGSEGNVFSPTENWEVLRLTFRVRSRALPGAYEAGVIAREGIASTCFVYAGQCVPMELREGTVTALPAVGPCPPDLFAAKQDLRNVQLSWENVAAYDALVLTRDGTLLAELPVAAVSYVDAAPPQGVHTYTLAASAGGTAAVPVSADLEVGPPIVAAVRKISCGEGGLVSWENARAYTRIDVVRNGELVAQLEGTAVSYLDPAPLPGASLYEVVALIDDMASTPVTCLVGGVPTIRLGSVNVPANATEVVIPFYLTHPFETQGFSVTFPIDPAKFGRKDFSMEGTVLEGRDNDMIWLTQPPTLDATVFGLVFCAGPCWTMPQAIEACYGKIILEIKGGLTPGEVVPLTLTDGVGNPPMGNVIIRYGQSVTPELINGEIVVGQPKTPAVKDLAAAGAGRKDSGAVRLTWRNPAGYDGVQVERNGRVIAELAGAAQSYEDTSAAGGVFWYRVRGVRGQTVSPWNLVIFTNIAGVELFRRGDANADGAVDLADAIRIVMHLFRGASAPCKDAFDANDDGRLDIADAIYTLAFLFADGKAPATPGTRLRWYDPTSDELDCERGTP